MTAKTPTSLRMSHKEREFIESLGDGKLSEGFQKLLILGGIEGFELDEERMRFNVGLSLDADYLILDGPLEKRALIYPIPKQFNRHDLAVDDVIFNESFADWLQEKVLSISKKTIVRIDLSYSYGDGRVGVEFLADRDSM